MQFNGNAAPKLTLELTSSYFNLTLRVIKPVIANVVIIFTRKLHLNLESKLMNDRFSIKTEIAKYRNFALCNLSVFRII